MRGTLAAAFAGILLAASATPAAALQDPAAEKKAKQQADFKEKYEAKLKEPWLVDYGWITDYDKAREKAAADGKLMVGYFTRSYSF
jgi:hypothetical protein